MNRIYFIMEENDQTKVENWLTFVIGLFSKNSDIVKYLEYLDVATYDWNPDFKKVFRLL